MLTCGGFNSPVFKHGPTLDAASTTVLGDAFSIPVKCARHVVGIYNVPRQCGDGGCVRAFALDGCSAGWHGDSVASRGPSHSAGRGRDPIDEMEDGKLDTERQDTFAAVQKQRAKFVEILAPNDRAMT